MEDLDSIQSAEYTRNNYEQQVMAEPHDNGELIKTEHDEFKQETDEAPEYDTNKSHEDLENDFENEFGDPTQSEINTSIENETMEMDTTGECVDKGTQEKIKKHQCNSCERAFVRPEHLKRHVQSVHEGLRNFKCDFCEKAFSRSDRLKRHIAIKHEGFSEDAECELCGKSYYDKSTLKKHILTVHEGEVYPDIELYNDSYANESDSNNQNESSKFPCGICSKTFSRPQHVKRHMKKVHGMDSIHENFNPWTVNSLDDFLYFCCPECDISRETIYQSKELFIQHAMDHHPMAKDTLQLLGMKDEPYDDQNGSLFYDDYEADDDSQLFYPTVEYGDENDEKSKEDDDPIVKKDKKVKFQCQYCEKSFGRKEHLKRHVDAVHEGIKNFSCEFCEMNFSRKDYLKRHVSSIHRDKIQPVDKSVSLQQNPINNSQSTLMKEEPLDENDRTNLAPELNQSDIKDEIKDDDDYFTDTSYNAGTKNEPKKKVKCEICEKEFSGKFHLKRHMTNVHDKQRNCEYCGMNFATSDELKMHIKGVHGVNKEIKCHKCEKTFARTETLKQHISAIHEEKRIYACEYCGKTFAYQKGLKVHIDTVHEQLKEYKCDKCEKIFTRPQHLKRHVANIHEGQKNFNCEYCGRCFATNSSMQVHIANTHEPDKRRNFSCEHCGKAFFSNDSLKSHVKHVHDNVRNFHCELCGSAFHQQNYLDNHIASVHEGRKKFNCEFCGKSFSYPASVLLHVKSIHRGERHQCEICQKYFTQSQALKLHIRNVHNKEGIVYGRKRKAPHEQHIDRRLLMNFTK